MRLPLLALACVLAAPAVHAQHDHAIHTHDAPSAAPAALSPDAVAFLDRVKSSVARYHDRSEAAADGFRLLGPDMPNMGEHWIHPGRAISGQIDPEQPAVLTYLTIDGQSTLTGAAFTMPIRPGQSPPPFPHAPWHFHSTDLDKEAYGLVPHGAFHGDDAAVTTRLGMIHTWVALDNPDGAFSDDHWGLSFARHGLVPPAGVPLRDASLALFLASDAGLPFFTRMFDLMETTPAEHAQLAALLAAGQRDVRMHLSHVRPDAGEPVSASGVAVLGAAWQQVRAGAESVLGRERIAGLMLF